MENKKCLITGGAGFIGSALTRALLRAGHEVRILDNTSRGSLTRLEDIKDKIEIIECDIRNAKKVREACKNINSVFHLAFINGTEFFYSKPDLVLDVGVKGMVNILDSCIDEGIKEFILASSSEVYQKPPIIPTKEDVPLSIPDPHNPRYSYAGGKIISELMALNNGKLFDRVMIFRPHNVYGPDMGWEHVIPQFILRMNKACIRNNDKKIDFPIKGTGNETRSFVFIDDLIKGVMLMLKKGEHLGIYNIGTMDEISISKVAVNLGKLFGRDVNVVPGEAVKGSTPRRCPDISKLKKLGYTPRVTFSEGLKVTAKWYIENHDKNPNDA